MLCELLTPNNFEHLIKFQQFYGVAEARPKPRNQRKRKIRIKMPLTRLPNKSMLCRKLMASIYKIQVSHEKIINLNLTLSEDKEEAPVNVESSPQTTPAPSAHTAQVQAPSSQPEVDEDGYCIQPKDPLWELQTMKKGGK